MAILHRHAVRGDERAPVTLRHVHEDRVRLEADGPTGHLVAEGGDLFTATVRLRLALENEGWLLEIQGARGDTYPSAMGRDSGGRLVYVLRRGQPARSEDLVETLAPLEAGATPTTVAEQRANFDRWIREAGTAPARPPTRPPDFWIASNEYQRWWDPEPARVIRGVESDGAVGWSLCLVELEHTGEHVLVGRSIPLPVRPGTAVGVLVFHVPEGWDGREPLAERELRFHSEPELYASAEEAPVVSAEFRERVRRGWAF